VVLRVIATSTLVSLDTRLFRIRRHATTYIFVAVITLAVPSTYTYSCRRRIYLHIAVAMLPTYRRPIYLHIAVAMLPTYIAVADPPLFIAVTVIAAPLTYISPSPPPSTYISPSPCYPSCFHLGSEPCFYSVIDAERRVV